MPRPVWTAPQLPLAFDVGPRRVCESCLDDATTPGGRRIPVVARVVWARVDDQVTDDQLATYGHLWPDSDDGTPAAADVLADGADSLRSAEGG